MAESEAVKLEPDSAIVFNSNLVPEVPYAFCHQLLFRTWRRGAHRHDAESDKY